MEEQRDNGVTEAPYTNAEMDHLRQWVRQGRVGFERSIYDDTHSLESLRLQIGQIVQNFPGDINQGGLELRGKESLNGKSEAPGRLLRPRTHQLGRLTSIE